MASLAERMAARRAKLEEDEEAGMYFKGPSSGGPSSRPGANAAPRSSGQRGQPAPPGGAPGIAAPAAPPSGIGGGLGLGDVSLQEEEDESDEEEGGLSDIAKYQAKLKAADVGNQLGKYQEELKDRDAADAVVGLACGNLEEAAPPSQFPSRTRGCLGLRADQT